MRPEESLPPIAQEARTEHKRLHARLSALRELCADTSKNTVRHATLVAMELAELRRLLAAHFDSEDRGGWLEEAACRLPCLSAELIGLEYEHRQILESLDRLVRVAGQADADAAAWAKLQLEVDAVCTQVLRHEESEEQILQQGFNRDLETTD